MKIRCKKKRLYANLILGIIWVAYGVFNLVNDKNTNWLDYAFLAFGIIYIGIFLLESYNHYLTIENGIIKKNFIFGKKLYLNEIIKVKKFAGDYTLITKNQEMKISSVFIDNKSLKDLNEVLEKLKLSTKK